MSIQTINRPWWRKKQYAWLDLKVPAMKTFTIDLMDLEDWYCLCEAVWAERKKLTEIDITAQQELL